MATSFHVTRLEVTPGLHMPRVTREDHIGTRGCGTRVENIAARGRARERKSPAPRSAR